MTLSAKEKELVAVGVSVAAGCKPCTNYHVKEVRKTGADDKEILQAVEDALEVRRAAVDVMENHALHQLGQLGAGGTEEESEKVEAPERIRQLVRIGAAFAVNCPSSLNRHLTAGAACAISQEEAKAVAKLTTFIRGKAISHVEKLIPVEEQTETEKEPEKKEGMFAGCMQMMKCG